jgi:hypothetical protein
MIIITITITITIIIIIAIAIGPILILITITLSIIIHELLTHPHLGCLRENFADQGVVIPFFLLRFHDGLGASNGCCLKGYKVFGLGQNWVPQSLDG